MVAIQAAVIAFVADDISNIHSVLGPTVMVCFALSMTAGTILVGAIPSLLERPGDVWPSKSFCGWPVSGIHRYLQFGLPLLAFAFVEHAFFIFGIIMLVIATFLS